MKGLGRVRLVALWVLTFGIVYLASSMSAWGVPDNRLPNCVTCACDYVTYCVAPTDTLAQGMQTQGQNHQPDVFGFGNIDRKACELQNCHPEVAPASMRDRYQYTNWWINCNTQATQEAVVIGDPGTLQQRDVGDSICVGN
jgi:hypothetical protein